MIWTETRKELARQSLVKWKGTPHKNRIAIPGAGIDCVKFLHEVLVDAGVVDGPRAFGGYSVVEGMFEESQALRKIVEFCFYVEAVPLASITFGDIPVFKTGKRSGHVGFSDGENIWHSLAKHCVTSSRIALWRHEVDVLYRLTHYGWKNNPQQAVKLFL